MSTPLEDQWVWELIDRARAAGAPEQRLGALRDALRTKSARELSEFDAVVWGWFLALDRESLWAAVVARQGFCSDDGFDYFRQWLLLEGRERMHRAVTAPDTLADAEVSEVEGLCALGEQLLRERGERLENLDFQPDVRSWPRSGRAEQRDEPLTQLECAERFPRSWARRHDATAYIQECVANQDYQAADRVASALLSNSVEPRAVFWFLRGVAACEEALMSNAPSRWPDAIHAFREALVFEPHSPALWFALAKAIEEDADARSPSVMHASDSDARESRSDDHVELYRRALQERGNASNSAVDDIAQRLEGVFIINWEIARIWTEDDP